LVNDSKNAGDKREISRWDSPLGEKTNSSRDHRRR
jgi:hypothetical protein